MPMPSKGKRGSIIEAFMSMIEEMPLEAIRVEDLIARANTSKTTFYRLFRDKYDVMNAIYLLESQRIVEENPDLSNWKDWTYVDMEHIRRHKGFYRHIISYNGQNSFRNTIKQYYTKNIMRQIKAEYQNGEIPEKILFAVDAYTEVNAFLVVWWVNRDCRTSIETLTEYAEDCMPESIRRYFN